VILCRTDDDIAVVDGHGDGLEFGVQIKIIDIAEIDDAIRRRTVLTDRWR